MFTDNMIVYVENSRESATKNSPDTSSYRKVTEYDAQAGDERSYQVTEIQKNLRCIWLNETSQSEKVLYCINPTVMESDKGKTVDTLKKISGFQVFRVKDRGMNRWITDNF